MNNAFKWGGLMAVALIIIALIMNLTGMDSPDNTVGSLVAGFIGWIITVAAIVMGIKAYKSNNNGYLTVGNGISQGLLICLVAGIAMAIWTYIYMGYIAPDMIAEAKEQAMAGVSNAGGEGEEMAMKMMDTIMSPAVLGGMALLGKLFWGLVVGLIAGLIMKNDRPLSSDTL